MLQNSMHLLLVVAVILFVLMLMKVKISFALSIATICGVLLTGRLPVAIVAQRMFNSLDSFTLIAIPLFIITGNIMAMGGVTQDLLNVSDLLVGRFRGGLGYVNVVSSMIFAGITGTAQADTASVGGIIIPAMIKKGYGKDFTVAVTAASSTIGILIPPSIPLVLYGVATGASIGSLFLGGMLPGILFGLAQMAICYLFAKKNNYPREAKHTFKESVKIFVKGIPALLTVVIIIGGTVSGLFTATESSCIACIYSLLLGMFYYKEVKLKAVPKMILEASKTMGISALMISAAGSLSWFLTSQGIPQAITKGITSVTDSKIVIILLMNVILIIVGMFFDLAPAVTLFGPIMLPIAQAIGMHPIHLGVMMVVNLAIGLITPPVGVCLFLGCSLAETTIPKVLKAFLPFYGMLIVVLLVVSFVPAISLWLPGLL